MSLTHQALLFEEKPGTLRFGGARIALLDVQASFWGLRRQLEALVGRRLTDVVLQQAGTNGGAAMARALVGDDVADDAQALRDCVAAYQAAGFGRFETEVLEWPIGRALIRGTDTFEAWMMRQHGQKADAPGIETAVMPIFQRVLAGETVRQEALRLESGGIVSYWDVVFAPLVEAGKVAGVVSVITDATERQRANEALRRQHGQLRALAAALAEAEEVERRQLARELYDQVGQNLTALGINLNVLQALIPPTLPSADRIRARLDDSLALVEQTAERIRDVMASLRPAVLDDYGLLAALARYGAQFAARTSQSASAFP